MYCPYICWSKGLASWSHVPVHDLFLESCWPLQKQDQWTLSVGRLRSSRDQQLVKISSRGPHLLKVTFGVWHKLAPDGDSWQWRWPAAGCISCWHTAYSVSSSGTRAAGRAALFRVMISIWREPKIPSHGNIRLNLYTLVWNCQALLQWSGLDSHLVSVID